MQAPLSFLWVFLVTGLFLDNLVPICWKAIIITTTATTDFKGCAGCFRCIISILNKCFLFLFFSSFVFSKVDIRVSLSGIGKLKIREAK